MPTLTLSLTTENGYNHSFLGTGMKRQALYFVARDHDPVEENSGLSQLPLIK